MTTLQFPHQPAPVIRPAKMLPPVTLAPAVSLARLIRVELRKFTDTRASRWLLGLMGVATVMIAAICAGYLDSINKMLDTSSWAASNAFISLPIGLLLPVVAILVFTQEWTQRTSLTTFTLEPRRGRVLLAKATVVLLVGVLGWLLILAATAVTAAIGGAVHDLTIDWSLHHLPVTNLLITTLLGMAMGSAFALALKNTPAAIVLYFVLPSVFTMASIAPGMAGTILRWLDSGMNWSRFFTPMSGTDWAKAAVCFSVWILIPATIGVIRNLRSEAK